ncbi:hypothetical protein TIFTF001_014326 [Ficus carica]|uniref:Uncharacterized protein n=1 Tax=Ficus carica TaxID=3494 RepID=A0AA88AFU3_FICCA|nr:hypothetical protein TIFTF001_014326 [Ficus carica]
MGDPKVGPLGEDGGNFQFLVTYGESDPKFLYKRIKVTKSEKSPTNGPKVEAQIEKDILEHTEEISSKLTYLNVCRAPNKIIKGESSVQECISLPPYKKEEYKKIGQKEIIIIEDNEIHKPLDQVANHYLPFHLHPNTIPKSREWYEAILTDTGSISYSHKYRNSTQIAYSSFKVHKILSFEDWAKSLRQRNVFKEVSIQPRSYSYFDYIEAWEQTLYYQNTQNSHSWFITLKIGKKYVEDSFPNWFKDWFDYFKPSTAILPDEVKKAFELFSKKNSKKVPSSDDSLLLFIALYEDEEEEKSETTPSKKESVSQLISSLTQEKRKVLPEEKKKLKQLLKDSSEDEDDQEDRSPLMSEDSYKAVYGEHFAKDPYEDYKNL